MRYWIARIRWIVGGRKGAFIWGCTFIPGESGITCKGLDIRVENCTFTDNDYAAIAIVR